MSAWRYWAFLSYSHRDEAVAKALQRRLETYRLPRRLVGRATPFGPLPARLAPVFRDRDELHAGADLGSRVREALAASRWLVVVCTPEAARSPWVDREIREFKRLHGEQRVLALIAAGEPWASRTPGREAEECFPPALRRALDAGGQASGAELEPLAADLRPQGDGPKRAPLKLLAGMAGVGFDELLQREQQRRLRWLSALAGGALAGMAVFAVLAVLALQARDAAHHERERAEGLVEFMLVDLRKRLDAVGRLDVLDSVGARVLEHYDAQPAERLDAGALGQRARAQHLIGEIRQSAGQLEEALAAYRRAAETTAALLAAAPDDGQRIFDHAQSEFWVGYVARERGDPAEAERAMRAYHALGQRLATLAPERPDWRIEAGYGAQNLGVLMVDRGRPDEALAYLREARAVFDELMPSRPDLVAYDLAQVHGFAARAHEQRLDYVAARAAMLDERRVLEAMPDSANDRRVQRGLVAVHGGLSRLALARGDAAAAQAEAAAGVERAARQVRHDEANLEWLGELCYARLRLAEAQLALGEAAAARATLQAGEGERQRLLAAEAGQLTWRVFVVGQALVLAVQSGAQPAAALAADFERFVAELDRYEAQGRQVNRADVLAAGQARFEHARGLAQRGQRDAARRQWQQLADALDAGPAEAGAGASPDPQRLTLRARALWALGEDSQARALAAAVAATPYRHPLQGELMRWLAEGQRPADGVPAVAADTLNRREPP